MMQHDALEALVSNDFTLHQKLIYLLVIASASRKIGAF
jgi:hypothetical protein